MLEFTYFLFSLSASLCKEMIPHLFLVLNVLPSVELKFKVKFRKKIWSKNIFKLFQYLFHGNDNTFQLPCKLSSVFFNLFPKGTNATQVRALESPRATSSFIAAQFCTVCIQRKWQKLPSLSGHATQLAGS